MVQRGCAADLDPRRTIVLSLMITMLILSRCAVHPWSHNRPMDSSRLVGKYGNMWVCLIAFWRIGNNSLYVWDDTTSFPLGMFTDMEWVAICCLVWG